MAILAFLSGLALAGLAHRFTRRLASAAFLRALLAPRFLRALATAAATASACGLASVTRLARAGRHARTRTARGPSARFRPAFALAGAGLADVPGAAAQFVVRHTHSAVEIVLHMRLVVNV